MAFNVGITVTAKNNTDRALNKTNKNLDKVGKTAARTANKLKGLRLALGLIAVGTLVRLGKGLVDTIGKLQLMFVRLSVVEGGAKKAKKTLDALFKTFGTGPFSIDAVADSIIRLQSAGVDNKLAKRIVEFGADAIAAFGGTSEELRRFSIGVQQVAGKGVLSMEELRQQIGEALPVAMRVFAVESNRSISQVIAAVEKGEISAGEFIELLANGLEKEFSGFQAKLGSTVLGSIQGAKSAINKAFIDTFVTGGNDAAIRLTAIFQNVGKAIANFIRNISAEDVNDFFGALAAGAKIVIGVGQAILVLARIVLKLAAIMDNKFLQAAGTGFAVGVVAKYGMIGARLFGLGPVGIIAGIGLIAASFIPFKKILKGLTGIEIADEGLGAEAARKRREAAAGGIKKQAEAQGWLNKITSIGNQIFDKNEAQLKTIKDEMESITNATNRQRIAVQGLNKTATDGARQLRTFAAKVEASLAGAETFPFVKKAIADFNRLGAIMKKFQGSILELEKLNKKKADGTLTAKELAQQKKLTVELQEQFDLQAKTQAMIAKERGIGFAKALFKANDKVKEIIFNFNKLIGGVTKQEAAVNAVNREYEKQLKIFRDQLVEADKLALSGGFRIAIQEQIREKMAQVVVEQEKAVARAKELVALDAKILTINTKIQASQATQQIAELKKSTRGPLETLVASDLGDAAQDRRSQLSIALLRTQEQIFSIEKKIQLARGDPATQENLKKQMVILGEIALAQDAALRATSAAAMASQQLWSSVRDTMVEAAETGLKGLITGTKTFQEVTRAAFDAITNAAIKYLIELVRIKLQTAAINAMSSSGDSGGGGGGGDFFSMAASAIGSFFASKTGNAVKKFANGGIASQIGSVVKGPSMFGLAGEAGPEGILPLTNVNGKLGVSAAGGGGDTHIHLSAIDPQSGAQFLFKNAPLIVNLLRNEEQLNGGVGKSR